MILSYRAHLSLFRYVGVTVDPNWTNVSKIPRKTALNFLSIYQHSKPRTGYAKIGKRLVPNGPATVSPVQIEESSGPGQEQLASPSTPNPGQLQSLYNLGYRQCDTY